MSVLWRLRAGAVALVWIGAVVALALMDMRPSVTVLAAISFVVACVIWLLVDLGDLAAPVDWRAHSDSGVSTRGGDTRVRVLRRQIADGRALAGSASLHRSLVEIVDDGLRAIHGIDRFEQPVLAAQLLGPQLTSLVESPVAGDLIADPARLAAVIDAIELLAAPRTDSRSLEIR